MCPGKPSKKSLGSGGPRQGLTLVHCSAQLEPFLTQNHTLVTANIPYHPHKHPRNNP